MADNTQRFTGRAALYDQYRERYDPMIVLPLLGEWCGLTPDWRIADVGAGTGMLADVFLANGNQVFAVEPNAEMREACVAFHANEPGLTVVDATAEATGLAAASVELVAAGRALHWFDLDKAFTEFRRILKPNGWFVSVALGRADDGSEENLAIEALLQELNPHVPHTRAAYAAYARLQELLPRDFHHAEIRSTVRLDWLSFRGLILSLSHAPLPEDSRFPAFEQGLKGLFERFKVDKAISIATRYRINAGRL